MVRHSVARSNRQRRKTFHVVKLRRLLREWKIEPLHDIVIEHGLDLEAELTAAITAQILL